MVVRQGRTRIWVVAAVAAVTTLVPAVQPANAEAKRAVVFKPAKTSERAVKFRVRGVQSREVVRAALLRRGKNRRLGRHRARRVARRGILRVAVGRTRAKRRNARVLGRSAARTRTRWVRSSGRRSAKLKLVVDTHAPQTEITSAPAETTDAAEATFRFRADERKSTFECRVNEGDWRGCDSPVTYTAIPAGGHTFDVRARDRSGNVDASPASHAWNVTAVAGERPGEPADEGAPITSEPPADDTPPATEQPALPTDINVLFADSFTGSDGVITNHYAFWSPNDDSAFRDDNWEMESGCALRQDNTLWTGVPTSNIPNRDCSNGSGSEIFRLWTKRNFGDVSVSFSLRNNGYVSGAGGERSWDGIKIWLRRQGASGSVGLYTAEVNRRQGNIMIQKKCAGSDEYHILEQSRPEGSDASIGQWEKVGGVVRNNPDGSVSLALVRHGQVVLEATDAGVGCAPLTSSGRVGVRGDYVNFNVDDFVVAPAV